jgi:hypothetical protein
MTKSIGSNKQFGSSTIKRNDAITKGTKGKGIARLNSVRNNVTTLENKKQSKEYA